jgi:hypothetical protein
LRDISSSEYVNRKFIETDSKIMFDIFSIGVFLSNEFFTVFSRETTEGVVNNLVEQIKLYLNPSVHEE